MIVVAGIVYLFYVWTIEPLMTIRGAGDVSKKQFIDQLIFRDSNFRDTIINRSSIQFYTTIADSLDSLAFQITNSRTYRAARDRDDRKVVFLKMFRVQGRPIIARLLNERGKSPADLITPILFSFDWNKPDWKDNLIDSIRIMSVFSERTKKSMVVVDDFKIQLHHLVENRRYLRVLLCEIGEW